MKAHLHVSMKTPQQKTKETREDIEHFFLFFPGIWLFFTQSIFLLALSHRHDSTPALVSTPTPTVPTLIHQKHLRYRTEKENGLLVTKKITVCSLNRDFSSDVSVMFSMGVSCYQAGEINKCWLPPAITYRQEDERQTKWGRDKIYIEESC